MPETKGNPTVTFRYKISNNYAIYSIGGVYGGPNAQGDIIVSMWSERAAIPRKEKFEVLPGATLNPTPIEVEKDESVIRDVQFAIALDPNVAESIGKWLIEKAKLHKELAEKHQQIQKKQTKQ